MSTLGEKQALLRQRRPVVDGRQRPVNLHQTVAPLQRIGAIGVPEAGQARTPWVVGWAIVSLLVLAAAIVALVFAIACKSRVSELEGEIAMFNATLQEIDMASNMRDDQLLLLIQDETTARIEKDMILMDQISVLEMNISSIVDNDLSANVTALEAKDMVLMNNITLIDMRLEDAESDIDNLEDKDMVLMQNVTDIETQLDALMMMGEMIEDGVDGLNMTLVQLMMEFIMKSDQLMQDVMDLQDKDMVLMDQIAAITGNASDITQELADLEAKDMQLMDKDMVLMQNVTDLEQELGDLESDVADNAADIATNAADIATLQADLSDTDLMVAMLKQNVSDLGLEVDSLDGDFMTLMAQVAMLEGDVTALEACVAILKNNITQLFERHPGARYSVDASDPEQCFSGNAQIDFTVRDYDDPAGFYCPLFSPCNTFTVPFDGRYLIGLNVITEPRTGCVGGEVAATGIAARIAGPGDFECVGSPELASLTDTGTSVVCYTRDATAGDSFPQTLHVFPDPTGAVDIKETTNYWIVKLDNE